MEIARRMGAEKVILCYPNQGNSKFHLAKKPDVAPRVIQRQRRALPWVAKSYSPF